MDILLQSPTDKADSKRNGSDDSSQKLSREAFNDMEQFSRTKKIEPTQHADLPRISFESNESNFKYEGIEPERKALLELADKHIKDKDLLEKFKADMERFETRGNKEGLSPREIQETYNNISRLLKAGPDARVKDTDRAAIAHQIMRQAADPRSIDQGHHNTCNVTTLEARLYTKEPSRVTAMIADVVTTGRYRGAIGQAVSAPDSTFVPDGEARKTSTVDGERSFASQLFQVTAINLLHANNESNMRYEQLPVSSADGGDTGERSRLWGVIPFWKSSSGPNLTTTDMARIHELIVGRKDKMLILQHSSYAISEHESVSNFASKDDLTRTLNDAHRLGKFPVIMVVDTKNPPFNQQNGGCHVVSIRDFDATKGEVTVDNSWGSKNDIRIKIDDLYGASMSPQNRAIAEVNEENPNANAHLKALKLLERLSHRGRPVKTEDLRIALEEASKEWKAGADDTSDKEYQKTLDKIFRSLSFAAQLEFLSQMPFKANDSGFMGNHLDRLFAATAHDIGFDHKSMKDPGRQTGEYARKIVGIWRDMPEQRQQRILAQVAAKQS